MKSRKAKKPKPVIIQVTEKDGNIKKIGKYYPSEKLFKVTRIKSEHFMNKDNSWGLDSKVVDFLITENASVLINDRETKWEYKCSASDFKVYGMMKEYRMHRSQYFLPLSKWEVTKANNRSYIIKCDEKSCKNNFCYNCICGTVSIDSNGECANYSEDGGR